MHGRIVSIGCRSAASSRFTALAFGLLVLAGTSASSTPVHAAPAQSLAAAAESATGIIEGRVVNPRSGTTVENARVSVEGTALVTFTDADGSFRLNDVPTGRARVRVFFTGHSPQIVEVTIVTGQIAQREIALTGLKAEASVGADQTIKLDRNTVDVLSLALVATHRSPPLAHARSHDCSRRRFGFSF